MWQPRGSAPEGGDDVMAVMIRFSLMARDVSRAGLPPTLYRRLTITLRSLAIFLPVNYSIILPHPCVQPYLLTYSHTRPYTDLQPYICLPNPVFHCCINIDSTFIPSDSYWLVCGYRLRNCALSVNVAFVVNVVTVENHSFGRWTLFVHHICALRGHLHHCWHCCRSAE